ncbi:hypothetical protein [Mycobacterium leprae]|nr:hypothetical protein [Mycobacterium leprae]
MKITTTLIVNSFFRTKVCYISLMILGNNVILVSVFWLNRMLELLERE